MKRSILLIFSFSTLCLSANAQSIAQKVNALLAKMTLEEKVGQMTQISIDALVKTKNGKTIEPHTIDTAKLIECISKYKVGSILNVGGEAQTQKVWQDRIALMQQIAAKERLKIPIIYGIDAIHGNNFTANSVMFPQQIAQAASFNPQMVKKAAEVTAYETRATFIPWTFSPVLDLGRQAVWPRLWETFGEDPYLDAQLGISMVKGYQGNGNVIDKYHVAACLKHYMGYSMPLSGHDRTPAWIPERELREYFLSPFAAAVKNGAKTIMVNSAEINGLPVHANKHILTDILKGELQFKGFVVSDWQDIRYLYERHRIAKDNKEAVTIAVNAGIDMSMVPTGYSFCIALVELVKEGKVTMARIDDAVRRILTVKYEVGLFDSPIGNASDYPLFNSAVHHKLNYDIAAECITLLKNKNQVLPLAKGAKILVAGPTANSMRALNGGWARNWQGTSSNQTENDKQTVLEAIRNTFGTKNVSYSNAVTFDTTQINIADAVAKAKNVDVIVLCIGEDAYTETPGNISDLTLNVNQIELAKALAATGKPIVYVLAEGRPRVISAIEPFANAVLQTFLLGNEGGHVVADVLIGKINPSGKLPYTYPRHPNGLLNYYHKYTETLEFNEWSGYNPQWEFGFGLSYAEFKYTNLKLSNQKMPKDGSLIINVDVTNTGKVAGKETVLLFVADEVASVTPEVKRLRGFEKIALNPGETKNVSFKIDAASLSFINHSLQRVTEPGDFTVFVNGLKAKFIYQ